MTQLCQAEFVDSRMCTSEEIMKTVNIPDLPANTVAWIQAIVTSKVNTDFGDISGRTTYMRPNCQNWSSLNYSGLVTSNLGIIDAVDCATNIIPVACCAPAQ